jgi:hypothetical protein
MVDGSDADLVPAQLAGWTQHSQHGFGPRISAKLCCTLCPCHRCIIIVIIIIIVIAVGDRGLPLAGSKLERRENVGAGGVGAGPAGEVWRLAEAAAKVLLLPPASLSSMGTRESRRRRPAVVDSFTELDWAAQQKRCVEKSKRGG